MNLRQWYNDVKLISLSISALGIISSLSTTFIDMLKNIKVDNVHQTYVEELGRERGRSITERENGEDLD